MMSRRTGALVAAAMVVAWAGSAGSQSQSSTGPAAADLEAAASRARSAVSDCAHDHPAPTPGGGGMTAMGNDAPASVSNKIVVWFAPSGRVTRTALSVGGGLGPPPDIGPHDRYWSHGTQAFARCFDHALRTTVQVHPFRARAAVRVEFAYDGPMP